MARNVMHLDVFISCTSDLAAERKIVEKAIEVLNPKLATLGLRLSARAWPDGFYPGLNWDGQAEINRQLGDGYDIFVGILGSRFGSPTPRAYSGTEEEFDAAYSRFTGDTTSVRVLFYFKTAIQNVFQLDMDQLAKVRSFREKIGRQGLYGEFADSDQFYSLVENHLWELVVHEWRSGKWQCINPDGSS